MATAVTKKEKLEGVRVASETTTPPEGGWGWMVVAACFLATICIRAVTRCVSIFFVEFQQHFETDNSTTAWIHSIIDCITMLCGGSFGNRFTCRASVILGGVLSFAGLVLSSFASNLVHLYICMGIITGLGFALSYTPAIAMVGTYFSERKALAYGIAMSGSGIGTFILAPTVQLFIEYYSWRGALLVLGGFVSNLCVCGALMRPLYPRRDGRVLENNMENLEKDYVTTRLNSKDTKEVSAVCSHVEPKHPEMNHVKETQLLFTTNGGFKIYGLENKLTHENAALLSSSRPTDLSLNDRNLAKHLLHSNKLTQTLPGESVWSDPKLANSGTIENLPQVGSMNFNEKASDINIKKEDSDHYLEQTISPPGPLITTENASRRHCCCLKSTQEFTLLTSPSFLILSVSFLFLAYGCSTPVVHLVPYALSLGIAHKQAAFLMAIFGVSGIVGNITFGWIADRKCLKRHRMLSYMLAVGMEGLCCMFVPLLHSFPLLVPFSILYGYFDGAYVALIPVVTSDLVGSTFLTSALGIVYFLHGIPYLISPPIGGWLVDRMGNYHATFLLSGVSFMCSTVVLAAVILVRHYQQPKSNSGETLDPINITTTRTSLGC